MGIGELAEDEGKSVALSLINKNSDVDKYIKQTIIEKGKLEDSDWEKIAYLTSVGSIKRKAKNIYKTRYKAEKIIEQKGIEISNVPDNDLLSYFEDLVSNISNEDMQEIWARILVKEHSEQGSITKALLNTLSLLDRKTAQAFQQLCMYTYSLTVGDGHKRFIPLVLYDDICSRLIDYAENEHSKKSIISYSNSILNQEDLLMLDEMRLIQLCTDSDENDVYTRECEKYVFSVGSKVWSDIPVLDEAHNNYFMGTGQAFFTHTGTLLFQALDISGSLDTVEVLGAYHKYGKENW